MGEVHMSCGCLAKGDEWLITWWWGNDEEGLSAGCLCADHAKRFRAVRAETENEARRKLNMTDYCPHTTNPLQLKQCCKACRRGMVLATIKQWMQVVGITVGDMPYGFTQEQIDYYAPMLADEIMKVSTSSEK